MSLVPTLDAEAPLLGCNKPGGSVSNGAPVPPTQEPSRRGQVAAVLAASLATFLGTACLLAAHAHVGGGATGAAGAVAAVAEPTELAAGQGPGKVQIELVGMAGCPFTRGFIEGPLSETLATSSDIIDFRLHAFGNSYYATKQCGGTVHGMPFASYFKGYNQTVRQCWDKLCGSAAAQPAGDCFSGPLICQHGATDGMVTTAWACAKSMAAAAPSKYMPFVVCSAQHFLGITSDATFREVLGACADSSGLDRQELLSCASGDLGRTLLNAEARQTAPHPAVPYVLVDGQELGDTSCVACGNGIMQKVCEAWRARGGKDTPTCEGIFGKI